MLGGRHEQDREQSLEHEELENGGFQRDRMSGFHPKTRKARQVAEVRGPRAAPSCTGAGFECHLEQGKDVGGGTVLSSAAPGDPSLTFVPAQAPSFSLP